jgi:hypothetical protein
VTLGGGRVGVIRVIFVKDWLCRVGRAGHDVGVAEQFLAVAGAEEEGEPVQAGAEGAGAVGGVADECGEAVGGGVLLAAGQPLGEQSECLGELCRVGYVLT